MSTLWQQLTHQALMQILSRALQHEVDPEILDTMSDKTHTKWTSALSKLHLYLEPEQLDWCVNTDCMIIHVQEQPTQLGFTFETREQAMQFMLTWQPQGTEWWIAE